MAHSCCTRRSLCIRLFYGRKGVMRLRLRARSLKSAAAALFASLPLDVILNVRKIKALFDVIDHAGVNRKRMNLARRGMLKHKGFLLWILLFISHAASSATPVVWFAGPVREHYVDSLPGYSIRRVDIKCDDGMAVRLSADEGYLPCESVDLYMELMETGREREAERLLFRRSK